MKNLYRLLAVASAAFFFAGSALAQNAGTVTNHAFAVGKGPGVAGYSSLLCGSAQLAVGQAAADPICQTITGDVTIGATGVTALGNIPTGTPAAGTVLFSNTAAPLTPATAKDLVWVDSTDLRFHDKNASGIIGTTVVADTGALNNFLTGISAAGAISKARPSCASLSDASVFCNGTSAANLTGVVALSNGGTGQATAAAARGSSGLNVDSFTGHGDSIYTILATDRTVGTNAAFTASRTWTLPAANAVNAGQEIIVADFQGTVTSVNTLIVSRAGTDTVNGGTSVTMASANGAYLFKSDGVSKWTAQALGAAATTGVAVVKVRTFTTPGTYTPSVGLLYAVFECVGGGAGGGGVTGTASQIYTAGGGGAGSYSRKVASAAIIGASQAVTIGAAGAGGAAGSNSGGAGGDTSVGTLCVGKGGSGGTFASAVGVPAGGAGGIAGTGDVTSAGAPGQGGFYNSLNATITSTMGGGGSSVFGGGAVAAPNGFAGNAASNYGSGGSGGSAASAANFAGGNGSAGIVIVTEFTNQ